MSKVAVRPKYVSNKLAVYGMGRCHRTVNGPKRPKETLLYHY